MPRQALGRVVIAFGALLLVALALALTASLAPSERARAAATREIDFSGLEEGDVLELEVGGQPVWAVRPSTEMWSDLKALNADTFDPSLRNFNAELGIFLHWGISTHLGCALRHVPKGSASAPTAPSWRGGFVDQCHDPAYDYAGRTLRRSERGRRFDNLKGVQVLRAKNGRAEVFAYAQGEM